MDTCIFSASRIRPPESDSTGRTYSPRTVSAPTVANRTETTQQVLEKTLRELAVASRTMPSLEVIGLRSRHEIEMACKVSRGKEGSEVDMWDVLPATGLGENGGMNAEVGVKRSGPACPPFQQHDICRGRRDGHHLEGLRTSHTYSLFTQDHNQQPLTQAPRHLSSS